MWSLMFFINFNNLVEDCLLMVPTVWSFAAPSENSKKLPEQHLPLIPFFFFNLLLLFLIQKNDNPSDHSI